SDEGLPMNLRRLGIPVLAALWWGMVGATPPGAQSGTEEAICKDPAVFFCENFEDWALGSVYNNPGNRAKYKGNPWGANPGSPDIVNSEHFDGSKSLRMITPANQASGGAVDTSLIGGPYRTVYWRWYTKYSPNYVWSPVATQHNEMYTCCFNGQHGLGGAVQDNGLFNFASATGSPTKPVITY